MTMSGITTWAVRKKAGETASIAAAIVGSISCTRAMKAIAARAPAAKSSVRTCKAISLQPNNPAQPAMSAGTSGGLASMSNAGRGVPVQLNVKPYGSKGACAICRATARIFVSSTRNAVERNGSWMTTKAAITSATARARSFITMDDRWSKCRQTDRHVLCTFRPRRRVLHPFASVGDDCLPGLNVEHTAPGSHTQCSAENDRVFVELRALPRLHPPARADHAGDAHRRGIAVDPADVLLDALRFVARRLDDLRLRDMRWHSYMIAVVRLISSRGVTG